MRCFFSRACHCSGVFPRSPWLQVLVRRWGGPEASLFSSFRALPFPFSLGGSHGAWWNSGLSLNSHRCNSRPWAKSVFPLFLKFRWFRWFCGPLANATRPLTPHCPFSLSLPPLCYPLRIYIQSVSRLRDTKCSLQQPASTADIIERNAEHALCSDTCSFYYDGMNFLVPSFGVILP